MLIDLGTTTATFAANLTRGSMVVAVTITNALPIALTLMTHPLLTVHMLGARIRPTTMATVDSRALRDLEEMRADVAFVGTNAVTLERGLSTPDGAEAAVKSAMVTSARLTVLLADHTKFGQEAAFTYADLVDIDVLVTDDAMSASDAASISDATGIEVVRV